MVNKRACDNKVIGGLRCSTIEYVLGHITHVKPVIAVPIAWARAHERFGCQSKSMQKCHTKRRRKMPPQHSRASSLARSLHFVSGFVCPTLAAHYSLKSQTSQTDGRTGRVNIGEVWAENAIFKRYRLRTVSLSLPVIVPQKDFDPGSHCLVISARLEMLMPHLKYIKAPI